MPLRQSLRIGAYLMGQKLARKDKFPLIVELEPLFACNLKCAGCGKIQQPAHHAQAADAGGAGDRRHRGVRRADGVDRGRRAADAPADRRDRPRAHRAQEVRLPVHERAAHAARTSTSSRRRRYFAWAVHIDGLRERHDESVCKDGVFDEAVAAIRECQRRGFRVTTNTTFFNTDTPQTVIDVLNYLNDDLKVDQMMISPAYAYEKAPDQDHFLGVTETRELFRKAFADGNRKRWRLNHSPLFLDFLEGKADFGCTAWGIPSYSLLGWQRPCYLMSDGYAKTYRELIETPTGTPTAGARTRAARTAWRTAATSRRPCWPPWDRCGSPSARSGAPDGVSPQHARPDAVLRVTCRPLGAR